MKGSIIFLALFAMIASAQDTCCCPSPPLGNCKLGVPVADCDDCQSNDVCKCEWTPGRTLSGFPVWNCHRSGFQCNPPVATTSGASTTSGAGTTAATTSGAGTTAATTSGATTSAGTTAATTSGAGTTTTTTTTAAATTTTGSTGTIGPRCDSTVASATGRVALIAEPAATCAYDTADNKARLALLGASLGSTVLAFPALSSFTLSMPAPFDTRLPVLTLFFLDLQGVFEFSQDFEVVAGFAGATKFGNTISIPSATNGALLFFSKSNALTISHLSAQTRRRQGPANGNVVFAFEIGDSVQNFVNERTTTTGTTTATQPVPITFSPTPGPT